MKSISASMSASTEIVVRVFRTRAYLGREYSVQGPLNAASSAPNIPPAELAETLIRVFYFKQYGKPV